MDVGFVAIARPTFDIPFAGELADAALDALGSMGFEVHGSADLALDEGGVRARASRWDSRPIEALIVLQATFADSNLAAAAAATTDAPVVLWGAPEPRLGERLRSNSLCGINLAAFRLANERRDYRYVYADPLDPGLRAKLDEALHEPLRPKSTAEPVDVTTDAELLVERLSATRVGVVGDRPDGFEPCGYDQAATRQAIGTIIERVELDELFETARAADTEVVNRTIGVLEAAMDLSGLTSDSIEPSVRLHAGLSELCEANGWSAVATRCWPECFTDFGGAACTAQGLLTSSGIPAQCEADAYGAVTCLLLQWATGSVAFTADLVDADVGSDTAVVWHCGLAPFEMAAAGDRPHGTVHSNRKLPLVSEFALAPGRVTVARLSQSRGKVRMVLGRAEMLDKARPFSGTAGTLTFERPMAEVLDTVMSEGLEHHYGIAYGDAVDELRSVAAALGIEVVEL